jgi:dihydroxy-acid dehydratase
MEFYMADCANVCPANIGINNEVFYEAVSPALETLKVAWPQDRIANLRVRSATMNNGPLAKAMMAQTPVNPELPIVGLGVNFIEGSSCHTHTRDGIGLRVARNLRALGLSADTYYLTGVNDGITNGYPTMGYSNSSKDIMAADIFNRTRSLAADGSYLIPACDKGFPGALMGALMSGVPTVLLPAGSSKTGRHPVTGADLGILDVFAAEARCAQGQITPEARDAIVANAIQLGNCNGMFTADTMASITEMVGLGVQGCANNLAQTQETDAIAVASAGALLSAMEAGRLPRDIVTKESLDNAITLLATLGGSTNAILHLLAIAQVAKVNYSYADMEPILRHTPFRLEMQPNTPTGYWQDLVAIGGVRRVIGHLVREGRMHESAMTITGQTIGELYADEPPIEPFSRKPKSGTQKLFAVDPSDAMLPFAHIQIVVGSLAEEGAVAKVNNPEKLHFSGEALVFEDEATAIEALGHPDAATRFAGKTVVVRGLGPKSGMPELLKVDKSLQNLIDADGVPVPTMLVSDARQSGGAGHPNVTHVAPEAKAGGNIGLIKDGDVITIDVEAGTANIDVSIDELARRRLEEPYEHDKDPFDEFDVHRRFVGSAATGASMFSSFAVPAS